MPTSIPDSISDGPPKKRRKINNINHNNSIDRNDRNNDPYPAHLEPNTAHLHPLEIENESDSLHEKQKGSATEKSKKSTKKLTSKSPSPFMLSNICPNSHSVPI